MAKYIVRFEDLEDSKELSISLEKVKEFIEAPNSPAKAAVEDLFNFFYNKGQMKMVSIVDDDGKTIAQRSAESLLDGK